MKKILLPCLAGILLSSVLFSQPVVLYPGKFTVINQVTIYEHSNFTGQSKSFGAGLHRLTGLADMNDLASSIKVPAGFVAVVYEHANTTGGYGSYIDLMEDCADLSEYKFNDKISFLNVFSASSRRGQIYIRNKMVQGQFVPGHWERIKANGQQPDNAPPGVLSSLPETAVPEQPKPTGPLPAFEDIPVFRLQLRITTGVGADAGTDNPVYTQMNNKDNRFYLVKGIDNFVEGRAVTYDVISENIKTIRDIEFLRFGIKGDDGVCLKKVDIILNNHRAPVFSKMWEGGKGNCIDNGSSSSLPMVEISGYELRNSPGWRLITTYPSNIPLCWAPTIIPKEWITSIVEASIGNKLQYIENGGVQWGVGGTFQTLWGDAVESKRLNDHTLQFDLDLKLNVAGPDAEIDVDFELDFHCINGVLSADVQNFKNPKTVYQYVNSFFTGLIQGPALFILDEILNKSFTLPNIDGKAVTSACTNIFIDNGGNIRLR